jgi:acetyl esterase/lipase
MKFLALFFLYIINFWAHGQNLSGITMHPDTSFNTISAFLQVSKTHPEAEIVGEFSNSNVKEIRAIVYHSIGKRDLTLDAFYPQENSNGISILILHGGGWRSGNRLQHLPMAQKLAARGYTCFTAEYRLSTEALFPAAVIDTKNALRWIKNNTHLFGQNPEKIVICGFSAGAQLATLVATLGSNNVFEDQQESLGEIKLAAVVNIDGILAFIHPESGEGDDTKGISAATNWVGYSKSENPNLWNQASALNWVNKDCPPTLFLNSSVERMHAGRNDFIKILSSYGIYHEVKSFDNSPHTFILFEPWFSASIDFIDNFLKKVI